MNGRSGVLCMWITGLCLFLVGLLGGILITSYIKAEVKQRVVLVPGSDTYDEWANPDLPILLKIYPWHLKNPDEVTAGTQKPYLIQKGPYTYREKRWKYNITHNDNGTVTYRQNKTYHFVRSMSVGWDNDTFVTANLPILTLVGAAKSMPDLVVKLISLITKVTHEPLFITRTVKELVWGYHDQILKLGHVIMPDTFYTDYVGILMNKNNTEDGLYTVFTGKNDVSKTGHIDKYNGTTLLPYWTSHIANMVNGSDGTVFPPFVSQEDKMYTFNSDMCRSLYLEFSKHVSGKEDIQLYRFTVPPEVLESSSVNPYTAGFCTPADRCLGSGLLNTSTCQLVDSFHLPIIVSYPHFYQADPTYREAVLGMNPDKQKHQTYVDIEPHTGIAMNGAKRAQVNAFITPYPGISQVKDVKEVVFPLLWFTESVVIDDAHANHIKTSLLIPQYVANIISYSLSVVGILMSITALLLTSTCTQRQTHRSSSDEGDDDSSDDADYDDIECPTSLSQTADVQAEVEVHARTDTPSPLISYDCPYTNDTSPLLNYGTPADQDEHGMPIKTAQIGTL